MSRDAILITGAREHNLKDVTVSIPRNRLTVITGLSGSGKSSLAFDTLYAEGQRRYVESLSAYARQFLDQLQKPDVDSIDGLSPAIAIEQRTAGSNPRSIVATTTEIHDYLRLLYGSVGVAHCPRCGRRVARQSAEQIVDQLLRLPEGAKVSLLAPLVRGRKGTHDDVFAELRRQGFVRARIDGALCETDSLPKLEKTKAHTIEAVVDRLAVSAKVRTRLTDSVELALKHGKGLISALVQREGTEVSEQVFSELNACPDCSISFEELKPRHFSFNSPYGACPACSGLGTVLVFDEELLVPDPSLSIADGAIQAWRRGGRRLILYYRGLLRCVAAHYGFDTATPYKDLPENIRRILMYGSDTEEVEFGYWRGGAYRRHMKPFEGVIPNLRRRLEETDSDYTRQRLRGYMSRKPCGDCRGTRLKPEVTACTVAGRSIVEILRMSVDEAAVFFKNIELAESELGIVRDVLKEIRARLGFLVHVGLEYLTLDRESGTLSGGEAQRIRLATQIGSGLVGVLYVLDEPTIGLHQRDNQRLISMLKALRDLGNTVVTVEHDEEMVRQADYVIDLGPGAGRHGGEVICAGTVAELLSHPVSLTAKFLRGEETVHTPAPRRPRNKAELRIVGAKENNLLSINVTIPLGLLVCVTGVSGSGKSTLVDEILKKALFRHFFNSPETPGRHTRITGLQHLDKVIVIDQSPIGRTPRSNPATYTGAFDVIRGLFAQVPSARARGYKAGRFSFNVKGGRCETCKGDGMLKLEMHFLPDVYVTCEQCGGARYNRETLEIRYADRTIAEVLGLTIDDALETFRNVAGIERRLRTLSEVGLGYLHLGQPATTLSGGEAQRVKLAAELSKVSTGRTLYLLDEPTTGLHFADIQKLLQVLMRLRDAGNSIVVIEHNLDVIRTADHIVDLGPEGGNRGGRLVAEGTPEEIAECPDSYTGHYLKEVLGKQA
ncbi:MAG: excinuclease ABC subunit UvrA [Lentisphaerae bacterium]|nr:excinuclease ABC subunit UvrA [Lentisphaerota bacterium]